MTNSILMIVFSLVAILFSCYVFTNGIEWLGNKLNLGSGVTGSILAAIGTALPETLIPIIAILFYKNEKAHEIGIGAIAGSPFMLGTLGFFVTGFAVLIYFLLGKRSLKMNVNINIFSINLEFFIAIYTIAVLTTFINKYLILRIIIALLLMFSYVFYFKKTFAEECEQCEEPDALFFSTIFKLKTSITLITIQCVLAIILLIYASHIFVNNIENISNYFGIAPLILAIIISPIATELPEKFNSIIWTGRKKDTLAIGNIIGSMVFQSCFPVAFGIVFTSWNLEGVTMLSAILAITSAVINLIWVKVRKTVNPFVLMLGGVLYTFFIYKVFF